MDTRVGCYAWIERDGSVLLTYWSVPPFAPGMRHQGWTLPGGGMEPGEQTHETAVREVAEETGYEVEIEGLVGVDSLHRAAEQRPDGGTLPWHNLRIIYRARIVGGEFAVEVDGTTADAGWFTRDQIAGLDRVGLVDVALRLVGDPIT